MSKQQKGMLLVFITALISGVSIFMNGFLVKVLTPSLFTFLKNSTVAVLLLAVVLGLKEYKNFRNLSGKQWIKLLSIGLIGGCIPFFLFFYGLSITSGTMGAFIHKTMFLYIGIFAIFVLKEKIHPLWFLGAVLLLFGNAFFLKISNFTFQEGHMYILLATLFWAVENTISKGLLKDLSGNMVAFGRMFFGAMFMSVYLLYTGDISQIIAVSQEGLIAVAITSLFLLGYVTTWYNGIKHVPLSTAACILLLGSPITTLLSFLFVQKTITLSQLGGVTLIVLGIGATLYGFYKLSSQSRTLSTA